MCLGGAAFYNVDVKTGKLTGFIASEGGNHFGQLIRELLHVGCCLRQYAQFIQGSSEGNASLLL